MRTFYTEVTIQPPPPKGRKLFLHVARWAIALFAMACVLIDARLVLSAGDRDGAYGVLLRTVLFELEVFLAMYAILMTIRLCFHRAPRELTRAAFRDLPPVSR